MARYTGPSCRICRREGIKLFLKGTRCDTPKCAASRRERPPGDHRFSRGKRSAYGLQLREKQRLKRFYGILERQFRHYFDMASRAKGNTGEALLVLLERRLDNVLSRSGLTASRFHGRQLITHGNVYVDNKRVDVPSFLVSPNQVITFSSKEKIQKIAHESLELTKNRPIPVWMEVSDEPVQVKVLALPTREDVSLPIQEQLIVELLSK